MVMYDQGMVKLTRLHDVRVRKAINQEELAEAAGITRATLSRVEACIQEPYPSTVRKIAKALGVAPADLMDPLP